MPCTFRIIEHRCLPDTGAMVIFDVYAGDDPRDYMMPDYVARVKVASFRTRAEAEAYIQGK